MTLKLTNFWLLFQNGFCSRNILKKCSCFLCCGVKLSPLLPFFQDKQDSNDEYDHTKSTVNTQIYTDGYCIPKTLLHNTQKPCMASQTLAKVPLLSSLYLDSFDLASYSPSKLDTSKRKLCSKMGARLTCDWLWCIQAQVSDVETHRVSRGWCRIRVCCFCFIILWKRMRSISLQRSKNHKRSALKTGTRCRSPHDLTSYIANTNLFLCRCQTTLSSALVHFKKTGNQRFLWLAWRSLLQWWLNSRTNGG